MCVRTFRTQRERTDFWSRRRSLEEEEERGEEGSQKKRKTSSTREQEKNPIHNSHFLSLSRAIIKSHGLNAREHTHTHTHTHLAAL